MPLKLSDQEYEAVLKLDGPARYDHLIKRIADSEELFSLRDGSGWFLAGADDGRDLHPVWPHPRYAAACAIGNWAGAQATAIPIDEWLDSWLPRMEADGRAVAAFPTPANRGPVVEPSQMREDLETELSRYE